MRYLKELQSASALQISAKSNLLSPIRFAGVALVQVARHIFRRQIDKILISGVGIVINQYIYHHSVYLNDDKISAITMNNFRFCPTGQVSSLAASQSIVVFVMHQITSIERAKYICFGHQSLLMCPQIIRKTRDI